MENEVNKGSYEQEGPMASDRRRSTIGFDRRKQLYHLAEEVAGWIVDKKIDPDELCLFRTMVESLVNVR